MGKKLSLIERLEITLSIASSEKEKNLIYGLLAKISKNALEKEQEEFYAELGAKCMIPKNTYSISGEEIENGKNLAKILEKTIILPEKGTKGYGAKYRRARTKEYEIINNFYKKRDDGKNIQS
jgi:hypothetical protein